jgi:flagellar motor switch protein FliM
MMSGQVLSADAIAALVDAAKDGRLPEETRPAARRRRMRPVDFTRPTKFTSDQERRLKRAMEAFCRTAATRLSAELRVPVELEMIDSNQLTWRDAHAQVPDGSIAAVAETRPLGTKVLLTSELNLVLGAIELLLGGGSGTGVPERRLTDIDWALARHVFDRVLAQLSVIWQDMAGVELGVDSLDMHMEAAQLVSASEPTLSMTMEARLDGGSSTLALLLPWTSVAPVVESFASQDDAAANRGADDARSVRRAVGRVDLTLRAEVASREMAIEEVLALKPGDVLRLDAPAEAGITLFADKVPVHRAKPGRSGPRRAAQVVERLGGAS